jgi:hypothetical protein
MLIKLRNTRRLRKQATKGGILFLFGSVDHPLSMTDAVRRSSLLKAYFDFLT